MMVHPSRQAWQAMPSSPFISSRVWLGLPSKGGTKTLRGALMSMGFIPQPLPPERAARRSALATLADGALAFADVRWPSTHGWRRLLDRLRRSGPDTASRQHITLSRLDGGHGGPQDRAWKRSWSGADDGATADL
jgi:hypothetical protein